MRRHLPALLGLAFLLGIPLAFAGTELRPGYRMRRLSTAVTPPSPAYRPFLELLDPTRPPPDDPTDLIPDLSTDFDPGDFDLMSVAGSGGAVAYTALDATFTQRDIILFRQSGEERFERVSPAEGSHDVPTVKYDHFGVRMSLRGLSADGTQSNVYLHTITRTAGGGEGEDGEGAGVSEESETINVTDLPRSGTPPGGGASLFIDGNAWDPTLNARMTTRSAGGGINIKVRDARIAFISTADLDKGGASLFVARPGRNQFGAPQLFLWREREDRFVQLTRNSVAETEMNRPSMDGRAATIAFESTADLTPAAANPADPTEIGNPDGVRQIFVWRQGRGVRQITWGDLDSFSPRVTASGRHVFFSTQADLIPGGNPEGNSEIFRWRAFGKAARALRQMTQAEEGDSFFPQPTRSASQFVFYSTARPADSDGAFGEAPGEVTAKAYAYRRGRILLVHGNLDVENLQNLFFYGPPAVGSSLTKIHLGTSDPLPQPPATSGDVGPGGTPDDGDDGDDGDTPDNPNDNDPVTPPDTGGGDTTPEIPRNFFLVRATRFSRG